MTQDDEAWNESNLVENPLIETLQAMGYNYAPSAQMDEERESPREVILVSRLCKAIKKINPWVSDENIRKSIRRLTHVKTTSLIDTNRKVYSDLVNYISLEQDVGEGRKHQTIKLIDFEAPDNNEFLVTNQYRVWGPKVNIIPDVVVFINGIPVAVFECKSPTITDPVEKAIKQLSRYQENARGAPGLFNTNQLIVAVCREKASYATIGARKRHYRSWKDPWPTKVPDLRMQLGQEPTPQDILLEGMFRRQKLLDLIQNFIVFDVTGGQMIKKLARYQQYRAVNKAIYRVQHAKTPLDRGGVVWHTQGSGKSLTMVWTALKLRRMKELENPIILVATDRIDLDSQIRSTFQACGFPNPTKARGVNDLRNKLMAGPGQTIFTTIQKFLGKGDEKPGEFPLLSDSPNIFVMVDEAHRTQYKNLAANMRTALPNACYLGFTGTPIDKKDRSTPRTFGTYIDTYSIEQSVDDGATVRIYYEGRMPKLWVEGESLDTLFDRIFKDYSEAEKEEIKKRYANEEQVTGAPQRIEKVCLDLLKHYEDHIAPNHFKAQVVAVNRITAVRYKETLDKLNGPVSAVIISSNNEDDEDMRRHHKSKGEIQVLIDRFKDPSDSLSIIVVCDMLLTGFDAPVEQVMYLDKPLKEHNLLQAIARVNRPYEKKDYGLIVDYYGVSRFLPKALAIFHDQDLKGSLTPLSNELPRLQTRHRAVMRFFDGVDHRDTEACTRLLEPDNVRAEFEAAFVRFAKSMDMVLPDPKANPYRADMKWLGDVRNIARLRYRDDTMDLDGCGEKVRRLIEEHIRTSGVSQLIEPISILADNFSQHVNAHKSDEARASEMEHALRYEITIRMDENPEYYTSLRKRLEEIIRSRKEVRLEITKFVEMLRQLVDEARGVRKAADSLGFTEEEFAFYGIIKAEEGMGKLGEDALRETTHRVVKEISDLAVIDWTMKDDVQRQMRKKVKRVLRDKVPENRIEPLTLRLIDLARVRLKK